jgi:ABC-type branched-subunit amino acid transport system permease subunit
MDILLQGLLLGGLYALFALGLSLMFGVMRLTNTAQGDFIVLAAFAAIAGLSVLAPILPAGRIAPFVVGALLLPISFAFGYALQRFVLNGTLGRDPLPSLVVTFGLSIVIQNLLLELFSADPRSIETAASTPRASRCRAASRSGAAGRDLRDRARCDRRSAVAVRPHRARPLVPRRLRRPRDRRTDGARRAQGLCARDRDRLRADRGGGVLQAMRTTGLAERRTAAAAVRLRGRDHRGMGSFWGTLAGPCCSASRSRSASVSTPGWGIWFGHIVFLAVLVVRPQGLFRRPRDERGRGPSNADERAAGHGDRGRAQHAREPRRARGRPAAGRVAAALPLWAPADHASSWMREFVEIACYFMFAMMWNLLAGYGGMVSIGQQAFFGFGGYVMLALGNFGGINPFVAVPLGALAAALIAVPVSFVAFRLAAATSRSAPGSSPRCSASASPTSRRSAAAPGPSLTALRGIEKATARRRRSGSPSPAWSRRSRWSTCSCAASAASRCSRSATTRSPPSRKARRARHEARGLRRRRVRLRPGRRALLRRQSADQPGRRVQRQLERVRDLHGRDRRHRPHRRADRRRADLLGLNKFFSDYGTWYLLGLGLLAIVVTIFFKQGLWGWLQQRHGWSLFPTQRRLQHRPGRP